MLQRCWDRSCFQPPEVSTEVECQGAKKHRQHQCVDSARLCKDNLHFNFAQHGGWFTVHIVLSVCKQARNSDQMTNCCYQMYDNYSIYIIILMPNNNNLATSVIWEQLTIYISTSRYELRCQLNIFLLPYLHSWDISTFIGYWDEHGGCSWWSMKHKAKPSIQRIKLLYCYSIVEICSNVLKIKYISR